jgi:hypothetical protein
MRPDDEFEEFEDSSESSEVSREDKIFNNRYNSGDGLTEVEDYEFSRKISVCSDYSDLYLKDIYDYEDQLQSKFVLDAIFNFIQNDSKISKLLIKKTEESRGTKPKLAKEEINFIFQRLNENVEFEQGAHLFYSPIYIIEVISSISSIEYKKIFDSLETETQEMLLLELNKKYKFLDGKFHKKRIH